jgi:hypothetical protein
MNQDQRKFLIEKVERTYRDQCNVLTVNAPTRPSLNNYLIAAFLDNTIQFNDIDKLKDKMRKTVLKYGVSDKLVNDEDDDILTSRRKNKESNFVKILAEDLFVIPESYTEAMKKYNEEKKEIDNKTRELEGNKETIIMKIQIGSSAVLDKLITQVDNMADLNIMNSQFLLTENKESKQIQAE